MALREELEKSGQWLFRWRSYLPLVMAGLFLLAFKNFHYPFNSPLLDRVWEIFCLAVSFTGLAVRLITLGSVPTGTSGRNTKSQLAKTLNTTGMYAMVRHPLYFGNFLIWLGISLFIRVWWFSLIIVLLFWIYYERIMFAEEKFLREKFGDEFSQWAEHTPAFFPDLKKWQKPEFPFSWRTALGKEYSGFFAIVAVFTVLELVGEIVVRGRISLDFMWGIIFSVSLVLYLVLRFLKKKTRLLTLEGR
jgi:protein-S-isoprenylcysteine O-methyltransferase Ste14